MFCCTECFSDNEIRAIIKGYNQKGKCDFCGKKNTYVYEIGSDTVLEELFNGLLDVYTPITELPAEYPREKTDLIKNILCHDWRIFNLKADDTYRLMISICEKRYLEQPSLFDGPVAIRQSADKDYLENNSILKNYSWGDFVEGIKRRNRFHSDYLNTDILNLFLRCAVIFYQKGKIMYRARVCPDESGYRKKEMGAPPIDKAKDGRVNPNGISILYLSDSIDTTIYEIRAGMYDYVTVARFKSQRDLKVINLAGINQISPFIGVDYGFDYIQYAVNMEHLRMISQEIAKPLRNDSVLDYLPTQYISDYIRSKGYDGIEYISTMHKEGTNLAIFDPTTFKVTTKYVFDIESLNYDYSKIS